MADLSFLANIFMEQPTNHYDDVPMVDDPEERDEQPHNSSQQQQPRHSPNGPWFTIDDIPPDRWKERFTEFNAWMDLQMTRPNAELRTVFREFFSRTIGILREWFVQLGEYRQLQLIQLESSGALLGALHQIFLGDPLQAEKQAKQEYFQMKCYSLKRKDLQEHYEAMSKKFYMLRGINQTPLKQVFIAFLDEIQPESKEPLLPQTEIYLLFSWEKSTNLPSLLLKSYVNNTIFSLIL